MAAKSVLYFIIFFLFLFGTCGLAAYAIFVATGGIADPIFYAATAISWGVILLVLYLVFERQDWEWWS